MAAVEPAEESEGFGGFTAGGVEAADRSERLDPDMAGARVRGGPGGLGFVVARGGRGAR